MLKKFEIAYGSIIGRDHKETGKNNQDGFYIFTSPEVIIGIVCDGCGSGQYSEVGAKIGVRITAEMIMRDIEQSNRRKQTLSPVNEKVRQNIITQLRILINSMGANVSEIVNEYFLFTILGFLILPDRTYIFSCGDGIFIINNEIKSLSFLDNMPPYLAYEITGTSLKNALQFQIHKIIPTETVETILIGTDGVENIINAETRKMPGNENLVGHISQFWLDDKFFKNPDMIRRKLSLINRDLVKCLHNSLGKITEIHKENGLLLDDTTMIVVRKGR